MRTTTSRLRVSVAIVVLAMTIPVFGRHGNFVADWTFQGPALSEWQILGQASWRVEAGEIVGTPDHASGGWLVLNRSYQDVQFAASFRCSGGCDVGVMLRAEPTGDGFKGVYARLSGADPGLFAIRLDTSGREIAREPLRASGGNFRVAQAVPPAPTPPPGPMPGGLTSPFAPLPDPVAIPGTWNSSEILVDANIMRTWMNRIRGAAGAAEEAFGKFGRIALHVGGSGEVRFKDIELKDLARRIVPTETTASRFRLQRIDDFYTGWSAVAGDFNRDGILDVAAGNRVYLGPGYTESREVYVAPAYNPATEYTPAMVNFAFDYTGDGWDDLLVAETRTPVLYVNPRGESRRWDRHVVLPPVTSEVVVFKDVDGDTTPDAVLVGGGVVSYASVNSADPTSPWTVHVISEAGPWPIHGVGAGDVNGDGRVDILTPYGWWEQPPRGSRQTLWNYHAVALGRTGPPWGPGGAEMAVYDVNGDGRNDVVTSLAGHGWGLAWYEQTRNAFGTIGFVEHMIMDDFSTTNAGGVTFSELHGSTTADIDRDGVLDFVVGKRHFAHLESYSDPDPNGPAVLYWYRTVRNPRVPGGAEFVPELIHNRSGVGSTVSATDLNGDGAVDVLTATNRGTFIFWGRPGSAPPAPSRMPQAGR